MEIITESNRIDSYIAFYLRHKQPCEHCYSLARHVFVQRGGSPYDERNVQGLCDYHYEWAVTDVKPQR